MPSAFERLFDPLHFLSHQGIPVEAYDDPLEFYRLHWQQFPDADPHPLFDQKYYLEQLKDSPELPPLEDYLSHSGCDKANPNLFFDQRFYESTQMVSLHKENLSALEHFITFFYGAHSPQPNPAFNPDYFKRHNPDLLITKQNPIELLRFDPQSGIRIYGKSITQRIINAFALDQGPRRHQFRPKRYILLVTRELEESEILEPVLSTLQTIKSSGDAELIAISVPCHLQQIEKHLGKDLVSKNQDMVDHNGVLSEAALALNLRSCVSPFKENFIISGNALDPRLLFGASNLTFDEIDKFQDDYPSTAPATVGGKTLPKVIIPISDWQISGVNTWVSNISEGLLAMGYDVELLCSRDFYRITTTMALPTARLKLLHPPMSKAPLWYAAVHDYALSQKNVVFLTAYDFRFNTLASILPKELPMIGVIHSDDPVYYRACTHLGGYWQHIITVSDHIGQRLREKYPQWAGKISSIHYGIQSWSGELPSPRKPDEPLRIIYTGRMVHEQKRLLDLPNLLRELDARDVNYTLDLIGEGRDQDAIRSSIKPWIDSGSVVMHGRRTCAEIDTLLAHAHIFLLISDYEGLPLSLLEAMSHGVVPVVSDIDSGIPEVVHHGVTGFRAPIGDYARFAEIIDGLGESAEKWQSISKTTRDYFNTHLTREIMSQKTAEIIATVADPDKHRNFQCTPLPPEIVANNSETFGDIVLNITLP